MRTSRRSRFGTNHLQWDKILEIYHHEVRAYCPGDYILEVDVQDIERAWEDFVASVNLALFRYIKETHNTPNVKWLLLEDRLGGLFDHVTPFEVIQELRNVLALGPYAYEAYAYMAGLEDIEVEGLGEIFYDVPKAIQALAIEEPYEELRRQMKKSIALNLDHSEDRPLWEGLGQGAYEMVQEWAENALAGMHELPSSEEVESLAYIVVGVVYLAENAGEYPSEEFVGKMEEAQEAYAEILDYSTRDFIALDGFGIMYKYLEQLVAITDYIKQVIS